MHIHSVHLSREQSGLVSAGTRPDLHDDILIVIGVLGKEKNAELLLQLSHPLFGLQEFLLSEFPHLFVALLFQYLERILNTSAARLVFSVRRHDGRQIALLLHQASESLLIGSDVRA